MEGIEANGAKRQSRTWRLALYWSCMVPMMLIAEIVISSLGIEARIPTGETVALAGAVVTAYLGKRAVQENRRPPQQ